MSPPAWGAGIEVVVNLAAVVSAVVGRTPYRVRGLK